MLATVAVAAFVLYESTRAAGDPTVPELQTAWTYVGHVAVYSGLAFSAQTSIYSTERRTVAAVTLGAALFGVAIESYQSTLDGRTASPFDALANLAGAIVGCWIAVRVHPFWMRLTRP